MYTQWKDQRPFQNSLETHERNEWLVCSQVRGNHFISTAIFEHIPFRRGGIRS
jgi:hypothetical protein